MPLNRVLSLFALGLNALLFSLCASADAAIEVVATATAPNVILLIGDGMDEQQMTIARNYLHGSRGRLLMDTLPLRSTAQVLTVEDRKDGRPVYVADSANTATSMATGEVTSRGRIATRPGSDESITTIVELASAAGIRTGLVTTASVTDATPAAFAAHINFRLCENPDLMQQVVIQNIPLGACPQFTRNQGGPGSISEQLASSPLHVLLGGGRKHFSPTVEGGSISVLQAARNNGFRFVENVKTLLAARPDRRLLGLFAPTTLPVRLRGEDGRTAESPDTSLLHSVHRYLGEVEQPAVMDCVENPDFADVPTLKQMTDKALELLSNGNSNGFFLMVESASIDKQAHLRNACGALGEVGQLDEALASALAFAQEQPNTLVIVTSDHSHAAQIIPDISLFAAYPIPLYTPGQLARLRTQEGSVMAINYATTNFLREEHTGASIPLLSNGQGEGLIPSYVEQPDVFNITRTYLGL
ncbi:MAG: alkaline phosphatase [Pseudomonadota bacterium]